MSRVHRSRPARRAPIVERLESRALLAKAAAQVTFTEVPDSGSYALEIVGTSKNDAISINDDGKGLAGSLHVVTGGGQSFASQHPDTEIQVVTGGGKDSLVYDLPNGLQPSVNESLFAVSGGTPAGTSTKIKGGGTLKATVSVAGAIEANAELLAYVGADPQAATVMNVSVAGPVNGALSAGIFSSAGMTSKAKVGPVTLNASASASIGPQGSLSLIGEGGLSKNVLNVHYAGANEGMLGVLEQGAGANDNLVADLDMTAGSTGTVGNANFVSRVGSTGKGAKVHFAVFRGADSTTKTGILADVTASNKKSTIAHTANVTNLGSGTETILT